MPVQSNGLVDMETLEKNIRPDTSLVSIMTVNNEIGVIQPVEDIGKICKKHKVVMTLYISAPIIFSPVQCRF